MLVSSTREAAEGEEVDISKEAVLNVRKLYSTDCNASEEHPIGSIVPEYLRCTTARSASELDRGASAIEGVGSCPVALTEMRGIHSPDIKTPATDHLIFKWQTASIQGIGNDIESPTSQQSPLTIGQRHDLCTTTFWPGWPNSVGHRGNQRHWTSHGDSISGSWSRRTACAGRYDIPQDDLRLIRKLTSA